MKIEDYFLHHYETFVKQQHGQLKSGRNQLTNCKAENQLERHFAAK